jgi:hypothetical protein
MASERVERLGPAPPRAGYYIGYLAAKRADATRSVAQLAHLAPADVRACS